jgi:iron(III) transport system permease protein
MTAVASLTGKSPAKGLISTLLGLMIATMGIDLQSGQSRFTFGVPEFQDGIGFIVAFGKPPLFLLGSGFIIVLAYFIRRLPYSVRSAASILKQIDPALEEAAVNLGAPPVRSFRLVTMPLMVPGIVSGAIMSWVTAINEVSTTILLYVGKTMTMPIRIFLSAVDGYYGPASAMSTILMAATAIGLVVVNRFVGLNRETIVS